MSSQTGKNGGSNNSGAGTILSEYGLAEDILGAEVTMDGCETHECENSLDSDEQNLKYVTFHLDQVEYGLPIEKIREINWISDITRIPNCPPHIRGVVNLRGSVMPVVDLRALTGDGRGKVTGASRIMVIDYKEKAVGILVDRVDRVVNISSAEIEDAPEETVDEDKGFVTRVGKAGGRLIAMLDADRALAWGEVNRDWQTNGKPNG
jgi:purine-binding chemotaxis protein CheW